MSTFDPDVTSLSASFPSLSFEQRILARLQEETRRPVYTPVYSYTPNWLWFLTATVVVLALCKWRMGEMTDHPRGVTLPSKIVSEFQKTKSRGWPWVNFKN